MYSLENLSLYYQYLYPYEAIVQWLTYNGTRPLNHRELSFQYEGDAVQRYVVFNNIKEMEQRMISKRQQVPLKIDAGAIWSQIPKKESPGKTEQRQLIFDFDMNDYDNVRNCCVGKTVCVKCWKLIVIAIQILKTALQEDFDLHNFMYVFSGGRGVHIWVCDERARKMKDSVRRALIDYLDLVTGNDKAKSLIVQNVIQPVQKTTLYKQNIDYSDRKALKKHFIRQNCSYHVERSLQILQKSNFLDIFKEQFSLQKEKGRSIIQKILNSRSKKLRQNVVKRWQKSPNQTQKLYNILLQQVDLYQQGTIINKINQDYEKGIYPKKSQYKNLTFIEEQIMLAFLYPRMDYNVSTSQNHLLKLPFSIHPGSHKVSVPIFPHMIRDFDPRSQKIQFKTLVQELNEVVKNKYGFQSIDRQKAMENSPIYPYIQAMHRFTSQTDWSCKSQK